MNSENQVGSLATGSTEKILNDLLGVQNRVTIIPGCLYMAVTDEETSTIASLLEGFNVYSYDKEEKGLRFPGIKNYFGPLNLQDITLFMEDIEDFVKRKTDKPVLYITSRNKDLNTSTNACFLMSCYMVLNLNIDAGEAFSMLKEMNCCRGYTNGNNKVEIDVVDCVKGLQMATKTFFKFESFNLSDYLHLQENLNISWIIPGKMVAFSTPITAGKNYYKSMINLSYLEANGVKIVVRLNNPCYENHIFTDIGIKHFDLYFDDMTAPSMELVIRFLEICKMADQDNEAMAVHCLAGLGRTGVMIACYLMNKYKMSAREAVAWLRIVRPVSVFKKQQIFLERNEGILMNLN